MNRWILVIIIFCNINFLAGQCPNGPRHNFWHPDQVDSFKVLYPTCDKYNYQFTKINGEYIKPKASLNSSNLAYSATLILTLSLILIILKLITNRIRYFK